mgnify:CR=1 FL=1
MDETLSELIEEHEEIQNRENKVTKNKKKRLKHIEKHFKNPIDDVGL